MASLTAVFELVDRISDKLDAIADSGADAVSQWEQAEATADAAFGAAESGGQRAAQSVDGVASAAKEMNDTLDDASRSMDDAASSTDYWTAAVGNYSKEALEAVYSTEELVEMGFKTQEALEAEANAAQAAEEALDDLEEQSSDTEDSQDDMGGAGVTAAQGIASALTAAGITAKLKEITEAAYELVTAFSEAESTVVIATGATGSVLDGLTDSMMDAYAASKTGDLSATAAAIGEINTRMGLTGSTLTATTKLFTDFAAVTGGTAAASVRNVTQLMSQWNVGAEDLESTLDKLTYAGQVSGISVDNLSAQLTSNKAILDQLGFSLDESIAMFSQFELSGTQSAAVMTGFRTALTNGTISSLEDLYEVFEQISTGEMDAAAAADLFGTRASTQIVNAVNQGALSLDDMVNALENTAGTTVKTAEAAQTLDQKWEQATKNINAAFTSQIEPIVGTLSGGLAGIANTVGDFLNEHPAVTKAITAIGVGLGVAAIAIVGVSVASLTAIPAVAALGTAISAAIWPITAIAAAVAAVTAAVLFLANAFQEDLGETEGMTAATRAQYYALQDLNAEYEAACETYGETSEEASRLKYQMDDLEASFEANKITVEEFTAQCDALAESHGELAQSYADANAAIDSEEIGALALIQKLDDLASSSDQTASSQMQMQSIVDSLNESFPDLALSIEDVTENTDAMVAALKKAAEEQAEQERYQESYGTYVDLLKEQASLEDQIAAAEENIRLEQERMDNMSGWSHFWTAGEWDDLEAYQAALEELQAAYADNLELQAQCETVMQEYADASAAAAEATVSYEDAVSTAISSVQEDMDALCEAYDTAYESARTSIDGQIGLFDTMATETELSISDMQSAFDSQIEYLNTYSENLRKAAEYGLDEGLIASLSDGSEESAGYLNAIIENIEALGESSSEAQQFVDDFNASFQEVEAAKDEFATTVATMETDFDAKMAEIEGRLDEAIDNMNMETDAATAAKDTMAAYTQAIRDSTAGAVTAAEAAAAAVASALNTTYSGGTSITVAGHAAGTTDAEDVFVAGENGPELIVGAGGSTVFPADETRRIINAVDDTRDRSTNFYLPTVSYDTDESRSGNDERASDRKVYLEIAGKGNIELTGGKVDEETLLAFLYDYLKPVLAEIVTQEIFEEGDARYEY